VGGAPLRTPAHASQREEPAHDAHQYGHGVQGLLGEHVMAGVVRHTTRLRFVCLSAVEHALHKLRSKPIGTQKIAACEEASAIDEERCSKLRMCVPWNGMEWHGHAP